MRAHTDRSPAYIVHTVDSTAYLDFRSAQYFCVLFVFSWPAENMPRSHESSETACDLVFYSGAWRTCVCVLCLLRSNWPLLLFIACHFMLFCFVLLSDFILVWTLSVCSVPIFCSASLGFLCLFTCCWWWQSTVGGPKTQFSRCWMFVSGAGGEDGSDTRSDNQQWMDFWPNNKTYKMVMQLSGIVRIQKPCSLRLAGGTKLAATKMLLEISP